MKDFEKVSTTKSYLITRGYNITIEGHITKQLTPFEKKGKLDFKPTAKEKRALAFLKGWGYIWCGVVK